MLEKLPERIEAVFEAAGEAQKRRIVGIFGGDLMEPRGELFGGPRGGLSGDRLRKADQYLDASAFSEGGTHTNSELEGCKDARDKSSDPPCCGPRPPPQGKDSDTKEGESCVKGCQGFLLDDKLFGGAPEQGASLAVDLGDEPEFTAHGEVDVGIALTAFEGDGWARGFGQGELLPDIQPEVGLFGRGEFRGVDGRRLLGLGWFVHGGLRPLGSSKVDGVCVLWRRSLKRLEGRGKTISEKRAWRSRIIGRFGGM